MFHNSSGHEDRLFARIHKKPKQKHVYRSLFPWEKINRRLIGEGRSLNKRALEIENLNGPVNRFTIESFSLLWVACRHSSQLIIYRRSRDEFVDYIRTRRTEDTARCANDSHSRTTTSYATSRHPFYCASHHSVDFHFSLEFCQPCSLLLIAFHFVDFSTGSAVAAKFLACANSWPNIGWYYRWKRYSEVAK